mgnify:CR=1 FL=1
MNGYKAFYTGKQSIEILDCATSYEAQTRAASVWNLKPSQQHKVTVMLCEADNKQVTHLLLD